MIDMYAYITHLPNINHISIYGKRKIERSSAAPRPCPSSERHGGSGCKATRSVPEVSWGVVPEKGVYKSRYWSYILVRLLDIVHNRFISNC